MFWNAVEELKKESNPAIIEEKSRSIYEDYISILSPKEVSAVEFDITGQIRFLFFFFTGS